MSALAVLFVLGGCKPAEPQLADRPAIRIGAYEWPGNYWIDVAWTKGWFAEAGLNVERIDAEGKYFESLDALASGKIDAWVSRRSIWFGTRLPATT